MAAFIVGPIVDHNSLSLHIEHIVILLFLGLGILDSLCVRCTRLFRDRWRFRRLFQD
jgi:hypothetical protein